MSHVKTIQGKDVDNSPENPADTTPIQFEIPDDNRVAGLGMPITMALCRKVVKDYHDLQVKIYDALGKLPPSSTLDAVREGLGPNKEIVSGIYGRDTLMHILEQEGCEGIRYISCLYGGEKSIVLLGVDKSGNPIGGKNRFLTNDQSPSVVLYEVKGMSKTRAQINKLIPPESLESDPTNPLFNALL